MRLTNKVILVTGAAGGIGKTAVRAFLREGARVIATDSLEQPLSELATEVKDAGGALVAVPGDVAVSEDVRRVIAAGVAEYGALHVLFNNAGIMPGDDTSVVDTTEDAWQRVMDVNLKGVFLCCKHGIPELLKSGGGSIINIASFTALMGCTVPQDAYTASKGGIVSLTRSLAVQYGPRGIRANAICPGPIETSMLRALWTSEAERNKRLNRIPLARFGTPEDVVNAGVFLASDESSWITGNTFVVDGGITVNYF
ncbi:MAG TPA: glucose 1-dehydrogenase [Ktedonobacterales bacterium]|nr:glucose 1-dehydrogenase [Ktedonobacterales bacterium]